MNLGRTTLLYYASRVASTGIGFLATIIFARILGVDAFGSYSLALAVVSWLSFGGELGVAGAVKKRISEGAEKIPYILAGAGLISIQILLLTIIVFVFRSALNDYMGYRIAGAVLIVVCTEIGFKFVSALMEGQRKVHVSGGLSTATTGVRSLIQLGLLLAGWGIAGLLYGYAVGTMLITVLGGIYIAKTFQTLALPTLKHIHSLINYTKYAWIGGIRGRSLSWLDITVLGFFVSSALVGVYSVSWMIAQFLFLFASSISRTLFPEISNTSVTDYGDHVQRFLNSALAYSGLLLIPGLIGGALIGDQLLGIYGPEFVEGHLILVILVGANIIRAYQLQLLNTLNALDLPHVTFKINSVFIVMNLVLNVVLIVRYGWIGAAIATSIAILISLVLAYIALSRRISFTVPRREIVTQCLAAAIMGAGLHTFLSTGVIQRLGLNHTVQALGLIAVGAILYFASLLLISPRFRQDVTAQLPR